MLLILKVITRSRYEDELIERIVVPNLQHVETDTDVAVRNYAARLLVDLCLECESKRCLELLDILERVSIISKYTIDKVKMLKLIYFFLIRFSGDKQAIWFRNSNTN